jgi:hypothetical protein
VELVNHASTLVVDVIDVLVYGTTLAVSAHFDTGMVDVVVLSFDVPAVTRKFAHMCRVNVMSHVLFRTRLDVDFF